MKRAAVGFSPGAEGDRVLHECVLNDERLGGLVLREVLGVAPDDLPAFAAEVQISGKTSFRIAVDGCVEDFAIDLPQVLGIEHAFVRSIYHPRLMVSPRRVRVCPGRKTGTRNRAATRAALFCLPGQAVIFDLRASPGAGQYTSAERPNVSFE